MTARTPVPPGYVTTSSLPVPHPSLSLRCDTRPVTTVLDRQRPAPRRTGTLRHVRSHEWGDPALVGIVALVVYALHGYDGVLDRDLGVFTYGGLQVSHGTPPYVDIFNSVGPLADAVPALAMWLGHLVGADPVLGSRLFFTVLSALCCSLLSVLARDALGSRAAGFVTPALFLPFLCFLDLASDGPREKTTMVLFLLACLILVGRRRWALAGACAALATLTWQPVLAVALGALAAAVLLDQQDTKRRILLRFTLGGLVPSAITVGYFLAAGALSQALDGFIVINAKYTHQPSLFSQHSRMAGIEWAAYGWSLVLVVAGLLGLFVLGVRALPSARRPTVSPVARLLVVCAAGGLVGTVWTVLVVNGGPDLFVLLPLAALGMGGVALLLIDPLPRRAALAGVVAVAGFGLVAGLIESVTTRDDQLNLERADVTAVLGTQPADAMVVSLSAPQVLVLGGRESPVQYQLMTDNQERYLDATYPGGMPGFLGTLRRLDPTFVAVGRSARDDWAHRWLRDDYWRLSNHGAPVGWHWYVNRSAGHHALVRAQTVHNQVMAAYGR
jgi:hypothetical protein